MQYSMETSAPASPTSPPPATLDPNPPIPHKQSGILKKLPLQDVNKSSSAPNSPTGSMHDLLRTKSKVVFQDELSSVSESLGDSTTH